MKNKLFDLFRSFIVVQEKPIFTGAIIDDVGTFLRSEDSVPFEDIVASANAVKWEEGKKVRKFPIHDQKRSFMCGAFSAKKLLGILYFILYKTYIEFSEEHIYQRRSNKGQPGMNLQDLFRILGEGSTLKALTAAVVQNDADADNLKIEQWQKDVGKVFALKESKAITLNSADAETMASVIQTTGKGIILLLYFTAAEWSQKFPKVLDYGLSYGSNNSLHHFAVAVDYSLVNGKKHIYIEDSAGFGGIFERYLSEEFIKNRCMVAAYPMNFKFSTFGGDKPTYDGTITSVQKCLLYEGFFPSNVAFIESLGPTTRGALRKFQSKYGIEQSGNIGTATAEKLRALYP